MCHKQIRVTAAANIQASLDGDGVIAEVVGKSETELDVYLIGNEEVKYIRILVKPNGSKGSGGRRCCNSNSRISTMCICCYEILLW